MTLLGKRQGTMDRGLLLLEASDGKRIVETGCAYNPGDWDGAGLSTVTFSRWAAEHDGSLTSVDIDPTHIEAAKRLTTYPVEFVLADSVDYLRRRTEPIDLLYLDSLDYPYGTMLDAYGGRQDLNAAIAALAAVPEEQVIARFSRDILPSQLHCLSETVKAMPLLSEHGVILIDDAGLPGGGKARHAKSYLARQGWRNVLEGYQSLWTR